VNRFVKVTNLQRGVIALLGVLTSAFWMMAMSIDMKFFFVAAGTTILLTSLVPVFVSREYDWFCPWSALILAVIYGCTFPSICMSFGLPSDEFVAENILLNEPVEYFIWPSGLIMFFVIFMAIGFFGFPAKQRAIQIPRVSCPNRLILICAVCGLLSLAAFAAYFVFNGGLSGGLSSKRGSIRTLDVGADEGFSQHGWLRHFAKLGNIALLLLAAHWSRYQLSKTSAGNLFRMMILGGLILVSIAFPFYSSSRAGIVWVIICFFGCLYYMHQKILTFKLMSIVALLLGLLVFVTLVRNSGADSNEGMAKRFGHLLLNRHGPDIAVTAHVVHSIPEKLEFQHGKTIAVWFLAPIPREILPSKPLIHSGPIIGQQIYKLNVSGVPPGSAAELYWNFHVPGVILGSLLLGILLKVSYQWGRNLVMDEVLLVPIYIFVVFPCAFKAATHSVGPAFIMPMVDLVTVSAVVYVVSVSARVYAPVENPSPIGTLRSPVSS
jgi:oligosaccharide repeat unit polymerase